jgi:magnesium transporter
MQTLAVIIRGLGNDTINPDNAFAVMRREFLVGSFNGIIFAVTTALITTFWYGDIALGMIVAMAMLITLSSAALFGAIIPVILERMEIDPAVASGIVMTTIVDIIGFFAILGLASLLLT